MKFPSKMLAMRADSDVRIRVFEIDTSRYIFDTIRTKKIHVRRKDCIAIFRDNHVSIATNLSNGRGRFLNETELGSEC